MLYIERQFHPNSHTSTAKLTILHLESNATHVIHDRPQIQQAFWVQGADRQITVLESREVDLTHALVLHLDSEYMSATIQVIGTVPGQATGLGAAAAPDGKVVLAVSAMATANGELHDPKTAPQQRSSGRLYHKMPVRAPESWITSQTLAVFCLILDCDAADPHLSEPFNVLAQTDLEYKSYGSIHLTQQGLAVVAGPRQPSVAEVGLAAVYYIGMPAILERNHAARREMSVPGLHGYSNCPRISADGQQLVYLQKPASWLEDEVSHLVVCSGLDTNPTLSHTQIYRDEMFELLLSPLTVDIADDVTTVYFTAEDRAEIRLFRASVSGADKIAATPLSHGWSIEAFSLLPGEPSSILLAASTINVPRRWVTLNPASMATRLICQDTKESSDARLEETTFESIEWAGADDIPVQAWLVKPRDFDASKSYPLLYVIHGGPNAAFNNAWASGAWRNWNFALFAAQGYVVVAPNATGSSGFGQDYGRRVLNSWGGRGYVDHEKGFEHIRADLPFVDTDRAIALGTSYGAYMMNWFQGQPLGREFKAMVTENGFVNMKAFYTGDLVWFQDHVGGPMYEDSSGYDKFNPIDHVDKWSTPALVIANELDYRVPVVEGIAVFQILQAKGIESQLLSFPDEAHITVKPENRLYWWHVVLEWCARHAKMEVE
ncbi:hypothetical protein VHEMI06916 [[Torrubiella] hemipterigena]|uniref:Dipeptidyl-peptidase V n=1 Tax=[Torrubiella] hemipterigena TaxID=1531966 RepID=A0A0A1T217_9HYPO|nr:hypothetical protein VHEMI06916 [[Torrubiella] hemipterigena]